MTSPVDEADLEALRHGDADAYRRIIRRHQDALAARMRRFAGRRGDVEELVHETFVQAYLSLHTYTARAPFQHWLNAVATRVGYAYWKRRDRAKRHAPLDDAILRSLAAKGEESAEDANAALHLILQKLPPRDRLVLTLLHLEERSVAETASLAG